jgi:hypothetical protein
MAFIDGPWDVDDEWEPGTPVPPYTGSTMPVPPPPPVVGGKTAYTTVRVKFSAPATPGSTVATGYEMASALEDHLKERFKEWIGDNMTYEVFVQTDIR